MERLPSTFFFFNDTATTEIYTLSLHDALPISLEHDHTRAPERQFACSIRLRVRGPDLFAQDVESDLDRKSTRLNSSHQIISYAVFCLKKKIQPITIAPMCMA